MDYYRTEEKLTKVMKLRECQVGSLLDRIADLLIDKVLPLEDTDHIIPDLSVLGISHANMYK